MKYEDACTPKQIANRLDTFEREWLLGWKGPGGAAYNAVAESLVEKGLIERTWKRTPLGLTVCAVLKEKDR